MFDPAARPIVCAPDRRLRKAAQTVRVPDPRIDRLVEILFATMRSARGLGLAAPQVGRDARVAVVEVGDSRLVLINPEIVEHHGSQQGWEGCLSVPHLVANVERPAEVTVAGIDLGGRAVRYRCAGLVARAVAHEVDHLAGRLYVDLVDPNALVDVRDHPTPATINSPAIIDSRDSTTSSGKAANR